MNGQMGFGDGDDTVTRQCPITGVHEGHTVQGFMEPDYWCPGVKLAAGPSDAHARRTDPSTSHEAAASLSPLKLTENRLAVLRVLARCGPMADEHWMHEYREFMVVPEQSPSGLRSRRKELLEMGYVEESGETRIRNRRCLLWAVTQAGRDALASIR